MHSKFLARVILDLWDDIPVYHKHCGLLYELEFLVGN